VSVVRDAGVNVRLDLVGDGPERHELEALSSSLHLQDRVTFHGRRSRAEIGEHLAAADVFALASRAENLTVAVIEALSAGLPVVVTDVGGHRELVDPTNGVLVPPDDPQRLGQALVEVGRDLARFDRDRGAERTRERHDPRHVGKLLGRLYGDVLRPAATQVAG
jgi:glycosyltransferase involved in cell wall biosynthesis